MTIHNGIRIVTLIHFLNSTADVEGHKAQGVLCKQALHQFSRTYYASSSLAGLAAAQCFGHAAHSSVSFFVGDKI